LQLSHRFSIIIFILCDPACGLHNNPHKMRNPKTEPNRTDPSRSENWSSICSDSILGMTNAFEIRIGDLIGPPTNGLKCDDNKLIS